MRQRVALILLVSVALAGCASLSGGGSDVPSGADAADGHAALESIEGTVEYTHQSAGNTSTTTVRVVKRPSERMSWGRFRAPPRLAGDLSVTNGSVSWLYDASAERVTRLPLDDVNVSDTGNAAFARRVFGNLTDSGESAVVANPSLPVGPLDFGGGDPALTTADLAGPTEFAITSLGTKTVAGRETHGVELEPVAGERDDGLGQYVVNSTYWFDAEYFHPLAVETVISIDGSVTRSTRTYRNVTFNPEIRPGRFQFEPPDDATVTTPPRTSRTTYETVAGAAENVRFDVPAPDVPAAYDLSSATVSHRGNATTVALDYENATHELTVLTRAPPYPAVPDAESVSLGPVNATASSVLDSTVYRWACDGLGYSVRGELPRAELRPIARSVAAAC